jgi:hypothetical protein
MLTLLFSEAVFQPGKNVTVRRGVKWDLENHKTVGIASTDEPSNILYYTAIKTKVIVFKGLEKPDLYVEHDPKCRSYYGLLQEMERVYPGFSENEVVTVIEFTL